ncbi:hypothetical protein GGI35DRAFT_470122 [Trichoderma velutinum]
MPPIKVGIVGYGIAAQRFHLPFILAIPEYEIIAVLQRRKAPESLTSTPPGSHCTIDLPHVRHYRTPDEFFADPDIELVVITTHADTHALFAEMSILAGKHVIVEKPFARSTEEADRVIELAKTKETILTCYQNRRWDGDFQTLKQLLLAEALGEIKEAEIHYDLEFPSGLSPEVVEKYMPIEGMSFGLGTHTVDQALVLFGLPKSVTGFFRVQRGVESEIEDSFTIILQYSEAQKDLLVTIKTSFVTPLAQQLKFSIRGVKGSYVKHIAQGAKPLSQGFGIESEAMRVILTTYTEFDPSSQLFDTEARKYIGRYPAVPGRWMGLYENVADAINGRAELIVKASQCRDVIRVIELAKESHKKGVTMSW